MLVAAVILGYVVVDRLYMFHFAHDRPDRQVRVYTTEGGVSTGRWLLIKDTKPWVDYTIGSDTSQTAHENSLCRYLPQFESCAVSVHHRMVYLFGRAYSYPNHLVTGSGFLQEHACVFVNDTATNRWPPAQLPIRHADEENDRSAGRGMNGFEAKPFRENWRWLSARAAHSQFTPLAFNARRRLFGVAAAGADGSRLYCFGGREWHNPSNAMVNRTAIQAKHDQSERERSALWYKTYRDASAGTAASAMVKLTEPERVAAKLESARSGEPECAERECAVFELMNMSWRPLPPMAVGRVWPIVIRSLTDSGRYLFVMGGLQTTAAMKLEAPTPAAVGDEKTTPPLLRPPSGGAASSQQSSSPSRFDHSVEVFDTQTERWLDPLSVEAATRGVPPPLSFAYRWNSAAVVHDNRLLLIGGEIPDPVALKAETTAEVWSCEIAPRVSAQQIVTPSASSGVGIVISSAGATSATSSVTTPPASANAREWSNTRYPPLPQPRTAGTAAVLNGTLIVLGGYSTPLNPPREFPCANPPAPRTLGLEQCETAYILERSSTGAYEWTVSYSLAGFGGQLTTAVCSNF